MNLNSLEAELKKIHLFQDYYTKEKSKSINFFAFSRLPQEVQREILNRMSFNQLLIFERTCKRAQQLVNQCINEKKVLTIKTRAEWPSLYHLKKALKLANKTLLRASLELESFDFGTLGKVLFQEYPGFVCQLARRFPKLKYLGAKFDASSQDELNYIDLVGTDCRLVKIYTYNKDSRIRTVLENCSRLEELSICLDNELILNELYDFFVLKERKLNFLVNLRIKIAFKNSNLLLKAKEKLAYVLFGLPNNLNVINIQNPFQLEKMDFGGLINRQSALNELRIDYGSFGETYLEQNAFDTIEKLDILSCGESQTADFFVKIRQFKKLGSLYIETHINNADQLIGLFNLKYLTFYFLDVDLKELIVSERSALNSWTCLLETIGEKLDYLAIKGLAADNIRIDGLVDVLATFCKSARVLEFKNIVFNASDTKVLQKLRQEGREVLVKN